MPLPFRLSEQSLIGFVATRDAARAKAFYENTLGLRLMKDQLPFALVFDVNGLMLRVTPVRELHVAEYTVLGWEVADIVTAATALRDAGVDFQRFPFLQHDELGVWNAPDGAKVAWFRDPDGNMLSISQH
jgi:catechol 2,3-dioxygenase-like lactoylglutathione lyase family enzyme